MRRRRLARNVAAREELAVDARRGFRKVPRGVLPHAEAVVAASLARVAEVGRPEHPPKVHMWQGYLEGAALDLDSAFLRFALEPDLLDAATAYLGIVPVLASIEIWHSWWTAEPHDTMRWHCDWHDVTQFKVYVFATDVTAETGPTTAVDAQRSGEARRRLGYAFSHGSRSYMLDDAELAPALGEIDGVPLTGRSGDVAILDTSRCFHMGGRMAVPGGERLLTIFQYVRPGAFDVGRIPRKAAFARLGRDPDVDERTRLVLGPGRRPYSDWRRQRRRGRRSK